MSQAGQNLKYLRKLRGWTQEEFANKLGIKRSLIGAYEEERADPRIDILEIVSEIFKLTLDELLLKDLSNTGGSYLAKRRQQKMMSADRNVIHFVPVKAAAGYLAGYADTDTQKHKRGLIFFGIAILIILAMIPWPFRQPGIGREWFPQF